MFRTSIFSQLLHEFVIKPTQIALPYGETKEIFDDRKKNSKMHASTKFEGRLKKKL